MTSEEVYLFVALMILIRTLSASCDTSGSWKIVYDVLSSPDDRLSKGDIVYMIEDESPAC